MVKWGKQGICETLWRLCEPLLSRLFEMRPQPSVKRFPSHPLRSEMSVFNFGPGSHGTG